MTPSAIVRLMASGFSSRGSDGDEKKASRTALVVHSLIAGGHALISLLAPTFSVISSRSRSRLRYNSASDPAALELTRPRSMSWSVLSFPSRTMYL